MDHLRVAVTTDFFTCENQIDWLLSSFYSYIYKYIIFVLYCKENTVIVNIKTEDGSENDAVLSDDSLLVSDSEGSIIERSNAEFDICTTTQDGM